MIRHGIFALSVMFSLPGWAEDHLGSLDQDMFKDLTANLGAALGYKAINPGRPLAALGHDMGLNIASGRLASDAPYSTTTGYASDDLLLPSTYSVQGLGYGLDMGGFYTTLPTSNIALLGGALGYNLFDGGSLAPTVAIRGTYTRLTGVEDLSLSTRGLELSISKGFDMFTPYAGVGSVWIDGDTRVSGLEAEALRADKYFMGFQLDLGAMNFAAETEQTGDNTTTSAKFGARF